MNGGDCWMSVDEALLQSKGLLLSKVNNVTNVTSEPRKLMFDVSIS